MASDLLIVVPGVLSAAVANAGTFTVGYPQDPTTGITTNLGFFTGAVNHKFVLNQNTVLTSPYNFSLSFGASNITVTNSSGSAWPINSTYNLQLEIVGDMPLFDVPAGRALEFASRCAAVEVTLGAPATASATAIVNAGTAATTNMLTSSVYLNMGGGRACAVKSSSASDTTQTVTLTGKDIYGATMTETFTINGTTAVNGKKAFNLVSSVVTSAVFVGTLSVGTADIFGLPIYLPSSGYCVRELMDGAAPTAGTFVAGVQTAGGSTATTGDVRGTYAPNSAANGSRSFQMLFLLPDPGYIGMPQA